MYIYFLLLVKSTHATEQAKTMNVIVQFRSPQLVNFHAVGFLLLSCSEIITSSFAETESKSDFCLSHQRPQTECPLRNFSNTNVKGMKFVHYYFMRYHHYIFTGFRSLGSILNQVNVGGGNRWLMRERAKQHPKSLTAEEWKSILTPDPEQFRILRESGTETAGTHPYDKIYQAGVYVCAGCNTPLYSSNYKYDSGTGWPSFSKEIQLGVPKMTQEGPPTLLPWSSSVPSKFGSKSITIADLFFQPKCSNCCWKTEF